MRDEVGRHHVHGIATARLHLREQTLLQRLRERCFQRCPPAVLLRLLRQVTCDELQDLLWRPTAEIDDGSGLAESGLSQDCRREERTRVDNNNEKAPWWEATGPASIHSLKETVKLSL